MYALLLVALVQPFVPFLQIGDTVPDATFTDQNGATRSWQSFRGHPVVVSFIYTRCKDPTECPLISTKFAVLQRELPRDVHLIGFTLDPTYDTPAVLHRYGELFSADPKRWTLATGDPETLHEIAARFGVSVISRTSTIVEHSEALGVIDGDGVVTALATANTWQPVDVEAMVRDVEGLPSSPWQRFVFGLRQIPKICGFTGNGAHDHEELLLLEVLFVLITLVVIIGTIVGRRKKS